MPAFTSSGVKELWSTVEPTTRRSYWGDSKVLWLTTFPSLAFTTFRLSTIHPCPTLLSLSAIQWNATRTCVLSLHASHAAPVMSALVCSRPGRCAWRGPQSWERVSEESVSFTHVAPPSPLTSTYP